MYHTDHKSVAIESIARYKRLLDSEKDTAKRMQYKEAIRQWQAELSPRPQHQRYEDYTDYCQDN